MPDKSPTTLFSIPKHLSLGKEVDYEEQYAPSLLQGVPRSLSRDTLQLNAGLPFDGIDIWNGYELSWLNSRGKPQVAVLRCEVPITSPNLIESKSFKLYLNSFNQSQFSDKQQVADTLAKDLSDCAQQAVAVSVLPLECFIQQPLARLEGENIDDLDVAIDHYQPKPELLTTSNNRVDESLCSDLLKSNCLITNQPDWASIQIRYVGNQINRESLLKYLISFRQHNEFHEQCVERIFCDILEQCKPKSLTVYARYTRRGGLDINPFRSNFETAYADARLPRQ